MFRLNIQYKTIFIMDFFKSSNTLLSGIFKSFQLNFCQFYSKSSQLNLPINTPQINQISIIFYS